MRALGMIGTTALLLLLGVALPAFAQEEHREQEAKSPKQQQEAKPEKQQQEAKPAKQEQQQQAKGQDQKQQKQEQEHARTQQNQEKNQQRQEEANTRQHEQSQGQWARDGQKDSRGHVYTESRFGREHHARFEENGGRFYNGYRQYSYGGYWFYASSYPAWFYQRDVYFILGADGLWYAVAYNNPSLMFQVNIG